MKLKPWGKILLFITWSAGFSLYATSPVLGKTDIKEIKRLNQEVLEFYKKGQYSQAIPQAQTVVNLAKLALGKNHPSVAVTLNNLGALYEKLGNHVNAETFYLQSLKIFKDSENLDHPLFFKTLNHLISLYKKSGNLSVALALDRQSREIRANLLQPESQNNELSINNEMKTVSKEDPNLSNQ